MAPGGKFLVNLLGLKDFDKTQKRGEQRQRKPVYSSYVGGIHPQMISPQPHPLVSFPVSRNLRLGLPDQPSFKLAHPHDQRLLLFHPEISQAIRSEERGSGTSRSRCSIYGDNDIESFIARREWPPAYPTSSMSRRTHYPNENLAGGGQLVRYPGSYSSIEFSGYEEEDGLVGESDWDISSDFESDNYVRCRPAFEPKVSHYGHISQVSRSYGTNDNYADISILQENELSRASKRLQEDSQIQVAFACLEVRPYLRTWQRAYVII